MSVAYPAPVTGAVYAAADIASQLRHCRPAVCLCSDEQANPLAMRMRSFAPLGHRPAVHVSSLSPRRSRMRMLASGRSLGRPRCRRLQGEGLARIVQLPASRDDRWRIYEVNSGVGLAAAHQEPARRGEHDEGREATHCVRREHVVHSSGLGVGPVRCCCVGLVSVGRRSRR
jgi:hypothetical protein